MVVERTGSNMESNERRLPSRQSTASTGTQTCCPTSLLVSPLGETHINFVFVFLHNKTDIDQISTFCRISFLIYPLGDNFMFSSVFLFSTNFELRSTKPNYDICLGIFIRCTFAYPKTALWRAKKSTVTIMCTVYIASLWGWNFFYNFFFTHI